MLNKQYALICILNREDVRTSYFDTLDEAQADMRRDFFNWIEPLDLPDDLGNGEEYDGDGCFLRYRHAHISDTYWVFNVEWYIINVWKHIQHIA